MFGDAGVEHGPRTGRYAGYRGWEDAHPGALIEVREPSVSAPVSAVVGVVTGAALPALPGRFRGTTQHSSAAVTGPGGGVPAFDVESDGRRLGGAPLRATGRGRLLGGRHVKSDAGGGRHPHARGTNAWGRDGWRLEKSLTRFPSRYRFQPDFEIGRNFSLLED